MLNNSNIDVVTNSDDQNVIKSYWNIWRNLRINDSLFCKGIIVVTPNDSRGKLFTYADETSFHLTSRQFFFGNEKQEQARAKKPRALLNKLVSSIGEADQNTSNDNIIYYPARREEVFFPLIVPLLNK